MRRSHSDAGSARMRWFWRGSWVADMDDRILSAVSFLPSTDGNAASLDHPGSQYERYVRNRTRGVPLCWQPHGRKHRRADILRARQGSVGSARYPSPAPRRCGPAGAPRRSHFEPAGLLADGCPRRGRLRMERCESSYAPIDSSPWFSFICAAMSIRRRHDCCAGHAPAGALDQSDGFERRSIGT